MKDMLKIVSIKEEADSTIGNYDMIVWPKVSQDEEGMVFLTGAVFGVIRRHNRIKMSNHNFQDAYIHIHSVHYKFNNISLDELEQIGSEIKIALNDLVESITIKPL